MLPLMRQVHDSSSVGRHGQALVPNVFQNSDVQTLAENKRSKVFEVMYL